MVKRSGSDSLNHYQEKGKLLCSLRESHLESRLYHIRIISTRESYLTSLRLSYLVHKIGSNNMYLEDFWRENQTR